MIYIISEENKLLLSYPPHLKNINALPCKMDKFFIFFIFSRVLSTGPRYWPAAEALRHGLNFSERGGRYSWSVAKKTGSMYPCRRSSLWTFCCNVACLAFHLPNITTGSFQNHQCQPTTGFFQSHQRLEKIYLQSDEKVVHFSRYVVTFFSCSG